ncbi:MAG: hypothetical protein P1P84_20625 [Deferrisomatales bacterium]|nr:hypothetical protein [Deferrisomatales bacterium]
MGEALLPRRRSRSPRNAGLLAAGAVVLLGQFSLAGAQQQTPDYYEENLVRYRSYFDYGGFEPELDTLLPTGAQSGWSPRVGVDATYTDNFDKDSAGRDAFWANGIAGLGWFRRTPRFEGSADYQLNTPVYKSDTVKDQDLMNQRLFGALRWQASEHLRLSGGGQVAQDFTGEGSGTTNASGLPATYGNRTDRYSADAGYDWRISRGLTNAGSYNFGYTNYVSDQSEGTDTVRHSASERLGAQVSGRDHLGLLYTYGSEADRDTEDRRQNHFGEMTWNHQLDSFPVPNASSVRLTYRVERVLYDESDNDGYWDHLASLGYFFSPSAATRVGLNGGYQHIVPEEGSPKGSGTGGFEIDHQFGPRTSGHADASAHLAYLPDTQEYERTFSYRVRLDHQFSQYTRGSLSASQVWDYEPPTSTTDTTVLTRTTRADGTLNTRFTEKLTGIAGAGVSYNQPTGTAQATNDDYWDASGRLDLNLAVKQHAFGGIGYSVSRRETDGTDDDYLLQIVRVFYREDLYRWLTAKVQYSFEDRGYASGSSQEDYTENRIFGSLVASW